MTSQAFLSKINRRQILIHFIASWFLMQAFGILVYLTDVILLKLLEVNQLTPESMRKIMNHMSGQDIAYYAILTSNAGFVGTIVAFILSLFISIKNRWFWFNSFIVLIAINLLSYFNLLGWHILKNTFLMPGSFFGNQAIKFSINGIYLLLIGIILFFSKKANLFINNNFQSTLKKDVSLAAIHFRQFILKFNLRQIVIHFVATWFFIYAFQTLAYIHNEQILNIMITVPHKNIEQTLTEKKISTSTFLNYSNWIVTSRTIGVFSAFFISLIISIKKNWFWGNAIIVLIIAFFLNAYELLGWHYLKEVFLFPLYVFENSFVRYLINGLLLLLAGVVLLFSKSINNFIEIGNITTRRTATHD